MNSPKAIVAMSGGVDSSVAAYLMTEQGYDCMGATMKLFHSEEITSCSHKTCCSFDDVEDARAVCRRLSMPFYVFNFTEKFHDEVIHRFINAYQQGCTPNPCIDCNRYMKFSKMYHRMKEFGYDYIVTGHYAKIEYDSSINRYLLKKAADPSKDQSYVLYMLTQEQLAHTKFPLGGLLKSEVRKIAEENNFINAKKRDSQDICFVPDGDYGSFICRQMQNSCLPGDFVDKNGNLLGKHKGIIHYTIGQRKGLGISLGYPVFVTEIRPQTNQVVLGPQKDLYHSHLTASDVNLISCDSIPTPIRVSAKIRYRQKEAPADAWQDEQGTLHVQFLTPLRAITKGQAVVLYQGDVVVGGGTIHSIIS